MDCDFKVQDNYFGSSLYILIAGDIQAQYKWDCSRCSQTPMHETSHISVQKSEPIGFAI
jgi:hypothetical protein